MSILRPAFFALVAAAAGGLGVFVAVLARLPFHGDARTAVGITTAVVTAAGLGLLAERLTRKDVRP